MKSSYDSRLSSGCYEFCCDDNVGVRDTTCSLCDTHDCVFCFETPLKCCVFPGHII